MAFRGTAYLEWIFPMNGNGSYVFLTLACFGLFVGCPIVRSGDLLPAFPGAEGFGTTTPGGRGGQVLLVENLNDSGPGSLRAACEQEGRRMVLFRIAGIIELKTPISIRQPFLTLAGQSAPGDGICLKGRGISVETHDVVIRYLRIRPGDISGEETDSLAISRGSRRVVIDHCSTTWSVDENLSPSGDIADITVQWCLIAEALNRSVHRKGPHGYGTLLRAVGGVSLHHNLWAHNQDRHPRIGDNYGRPPYPLYDIRNNLMYDFAKLSIVGDILEVNYIGNYLRPGPSTATEERYLRPSDKADVRFYMEGNYIEGDAAATADPKRLFHRLQLGGRRLVEIVSQPFSVPTVRTVPAARVPELVMKSVGATLPRRDAVDRRIVENCRRRTGSLIDSQKQVGGWPDYTSARLPVDGDRDGMPDSWEKRHKLNGKDAADAAGDRDGDGYTNLEEYLNFLVSPSAHPHGQD